MYSPLLNIVFLLEKQLISIWFFLPVVWPDQNLYPRFTALQAINSWGNWNVSCWYGNTTLISDGTIFLGLLTGEVISSAGICDMSFNTYSAIFQPYHGKNNKIMMRSPLYKTNMHSWIFIVLARRNNSPWIDKSPHSDTLFWFWANHSLFFLHNAVCLATNTNFIVFGLWCLMPQYFSYIVAVSFIGGGNRSTRRKPSIL